MKLNWLTHRKFTNCIFGTSDRSIEPNFRLEEQHINEKFQLFMPQFLETAPQKMREEMGAARDEVVLIGDTEVDGAYFGGDVEPANRRANCKDRRL